MEYARALRGTDEDKAFLIAYLDKTDLTYPWLRKEIGIASSLSNIRYFPNWPTEFIDEFSGRMQSAVRKQLETDPFNLSLIEVAIFQRPYFKSPPSGMHTTAEYRNLITRIAAVQPYHIENWSNISSTETIIPPDLNDKDMFDINAIVYSDHSIFAITNFMQPKLGQYQSMQRRGQSRSINGRAWPEQDEFDRTVGCRLATLIRLFDAAAEKAPERVNHVQGFRAKWDLAEVEAELRELEVCAGIWVAPIESHYFEPTEIDRRELL